MDGCLARVLFASLLALLLLSQPGLNRARAQAGGSNDRGILGDVLDASGLHSLVENLYSFRNTVLSRGGLDLELLHWFTASYAGLSRSLVSLPAWSFFRFLILPAAIVVSACFSLYTQTGLLGAVLTAGFLIGLIYVFPVFLLAEAFSKTGFVTLHGRRMLTILVLLTAVSMLILLFAYAYRNIPMIFSSLVMLVFTTCFAWFLPILLYYRS